MVVPKEKPIISNINSYYVDIQKLIEHYQGEVGSGGVYFRSPHAECTVFFDKDQILNGFYKDTEEEVSGDSAVERLIETADEHNYAIDIYYIDEIKVYFWSNIPSAEIVYKDLSTEFTELEGLIKKLKSEKTTGYLDVELRDDVNRGLVFFNSGEVVGGSYSWANGRQDDSGDYLGQLIDQCKSSGGKFNVYRIPMENQANGIRQSDLQPTPKIIKMLEELLAILQSAIETNKKINVNFSTLLKKKFVEKADNYSFLDPFAAEFEYSNRKIAFIGETDEREMANGVIESVKEIAKELNMLPQLMDQLAPWTSKYEGELVKYGVRF